MLSDFSGIARQFSDQSQAKTATGLRVVHTLCEAGTSIPLHQHESPFLSFLLAGNYSEGHGRRWGYCAANALTWHPACDAHQVDHGDRPVSSVQVEFPELEFEDLNLRKLLPGRRITGEVPAARPLVNEVLREMEIADELSTLSIHGCVLQTLALMCRAVKMVRAPTADQLVARIQGAVRESFPEPPQADTVAESLGLTGAQMAALYRRHSGESVGSTVRRLRISRACELLAEPDRPLSEIALDCGFCDQSHLNRVFAKFMRCTPGAYRKSLGLRGH